jgi:hypothetical protein
MLITLWRMLRTLIPAMLLVFLLIGGVFAAGEQIGRSIIGGGGAQLAGGQIVLSYSVGQPLVGATGDTVRSCAGLFCGVGAPPLIIDEAYLNHLPLVVK